jgi:hypothetical protein
MSCIVSITFLPSEANSPLVVDADTVLSGSIARETLQPISRRDTQIVQPFNHIKLDQLAPSQAV